MIRSIIDPVSDAAASLVAERPWETRRRPVERGAGISKADRSTKLEALAIVGHRRPVTFGSTTLQPFIHLRISDPKCSLLHALNRRLGRFSTLSRSPFNPISLLKLFRTDRQARGTIDARGLATRLQLTSADGVAWKHGLGWFQFADGPRNIGYRIGSRSCREGADGLTSRG